MIIVTFVCNPREFGLYVQIYKLMDLVCSVLW